MNDESMHIQPIEVGAFQVNCYLLWGEEKRAIVIDPGADAEAIQEALKEHALTVAVYLLTHGHIDHISGLGDLCAALPAPVAIHKADLDWAFDAASAMPPYYGPPRRPAEIARMLEDGQSWTDGGLSYKVIATPGHTPGSVCFLFEKEGLVFTGDTLFAGSVGRTDLPGGDPRVLQTSLEKLAKLPPATAVCPGHGPPSDIANEKRTNFFLQKPLSTETRP